MERTQYSELKLELKKLASEIKEWKQNRKFNKRSKLGLRQWEVQSEIDCRSWEFRHKHIAYCILNGRKYEQVERYCRNAPNFSWIDRIIEEYDQKAVCVSA